MTRKLKQDIINQKLLEAGTTGVPQFWFTKPETKKFGEDLFNSVFTVLAASALNGDTALEAFKNVVDLYTEER